jgi:signal transduction histidine kinase
MHQFFFRERYDLETSVAELRRALSHVLEIDEMAATVLSGLERSHRVTSCAVYLRDQDGNGFDCIGSIGETPPPRIETLAARPLLDRLQKEGALPLEEIAREHKDSPLPAVAAATLGALRNAVVLAVKGDDGEIIGLIGLADDRVRDAFTPEEITLLETVAGQIGVAIANSRLYSRMKERDRLAALGAMAAGLAHEVKNPLGAIKGAAQLLEEDGNGGGNGLGGTGRGGGGAHGTPTLDANAREFIGIILEEVDRLNRVVGSFLDYARPHAGNPIPLDINAAVRRTIQILTSQKSESLDVHLELAENVPRAKIDPEQFRQVLMNLVQNAIQAMDGRGRVTVSTQKRVRRGRWASIHEGDPVSLSKAAAAASGGPPSDRNLSRPDVAGEMVEVSVRDTGPGISQKVLKNLFVPFFTTKEQGTGLGLAISQSIVQNVGGTIDVQSQAGAGTTFTILLPAATDVLATPQPTKASEVVAALAAAVPVAAPPGRPR